MAPTIHANIRPERSRGEKKSDLVFRVKYNNNLPDIPFDPKFITYPFDTNRYVQYNPTSLERNYKFELLTDHNLGVTVDLINPDAYQINPNAKLSTEDEMLLEDEINIPTDSKRSLNHRQVVSWLRKTEYISTEYNRFAPNTQKAEARIGFNVRKKVTEEVIYKDRDSQIKAINATFDNAKTPIEEHYSKRGIVPVEVLPIFPDFEMWKHPCAQVIFDSDPAPPGKSDAQQKEEMSQAIICGEQFVSYFLPTPETLVKRKRDQEQGIDYEEDEEYEYMLAREYNWNVKNKTSRDYEENYFFIFKDEGVYYNELETRVRLNKRRKVGSAGPSTKQRLIIKHRPLTSNEVAAQDARAMVLEPQGEDDEEMTLSNQINCDMASRAGKTNRSAIRSNEDEGAQTPGSARSATPEARSDNEEANDDLMQNDDMDGQNDEDDDNVREEQEIFGDSDSD